jgi:hypothetical protein
MCGAYIDPILLLRTHTQGGEEEAEKQFLKLDLEGISTGVVLEPRDDRAASAYLAFEGTPTISVDPVNMPPPSTKKKETATHTHTQPATTTDTDTHAPPLPRSSSLRPDLTVEVPPSATHSFMLLGPL